MSSIDANKVVDGYTLGQNHILESLWLSFKNTAHGDWILGIREANILEGILKKYQPKHILELGTGIGASAAICAFTCPDANIYTVEHRQKCIDLAKILVPASLQERIHFHQAQAGVINPIYEINPFQYWMGYGEYDWIPYDFIIVDGCGPIMVNVKNEEKNEVWRVLAELPGCDVLFCLDKMLPGTIVYADKRKLMTHLWDRHLALYLEKIESSRLHTVYKRTERPLKPDFEDFLNSDTSYAALLRGGYFDNKKTDA